MSHRALREAAKKAPEAAPSKALDRKHALNKLGAALLHLNMAWKQQTGKTLFDPKDAQKAAKYLYGGLHNARIALIKESDL
jgi:hypothetical protein